MKSIFYYNLYITLTNVPNSLHDIFKDIINGIVKLKAGFFSNKLNLLWFSLRVIWKKNSGNEDKDV